MPRMTMIDADVIEEAIKAIATVNPMFRLQEEMEQYMKALNTIAEAAGTTVPWGQSANE